MRGALIRNIVRGVEQAYIRRILLVRKMGIGGMKRRFKICLYQHSTHSPLVPEARPIIDEAARNILRSQEFHEYFRANCALLKASLTP